MRLRKAPIGIGFDASTYVTPHQCAALVTSGYQFRLAYLRRDRHVNDHPDTGWPVSLSRQELHEHLDAGLMVSVVQFASLRGRRYLSDASGRMIGGAAAHNAGHLGLPEGTTIWVDAEWTDSPGDAAVMSYLRAWGAVVADAGYRPGCYVGHEGLTGDQWYSLPHYRSYWCSAMRAMAEPLPRGWCMWQGLEHSRAQAHHGRPPVHGVSLDPDMCRYDNRGDRPWMVSA